MMRIMKTKMKTKTKTKTKKIVMATAITTLLSATAAFAIKAFSKKVVPENDLLKEEYNGFSIVLDDLVKAGTITQAQEDAIRGGFNTVLDDSLKTSSITQAQEAAK